MDRITKSLLLEFQRNHELEQLDEPDAFERLGIFCTVSRELGEEFSLDQLCVGGGQDLGIDGLAVIVNGNLVTSTEEVDDLYDANRYIEARFVFVQTKAGRGFNAKEIGDFLWGVGEFFDEDSRAVVNDAIAQYREIQARVYEHSAHFRRGKPAIALYYVTTGRWLPDPNLAHRIESGRRQLEATNLFDDKEVKFHPVDADELYKLYQFTKNTISAEFTFPQRVPMPEMEGVKEAYLGVLPAIEYLQLVVDEAGMIRKSLFYDNVRDFQSYNPVNQGIQKTLRDSTARGRFAVLNNGVTIVAKALRATGNKIFIDDYQIVNGCQTTHVLYDELEALTGGAEDVLVPVRVICTTDENVTNSIITATNRQTEVREEDLHALSTFQRKLETYFASFDSPYIKLYYERRSRQYASVPEVNRSRIITPSTQIRAFASMFLDQPYRASRHFATLLKQRGTRIFSEEHQLEPYYASALAAYKLEVLFRNQTLGSKYKPARYVLMMILRYVLAGPQMPPLTANAMKAYTQPIIETLCNEQAAIQALQRCIAIIDDVTASIPEGRLDRDTARSQEYTALAQEKVIARL